MSIRSTASSQLLGILYLNRVMMASPTTDLNVPLLSCWRTPPRWQTCYLRFTVSRLAPPRQLVVLRVVGATETARLPLVAAGRRQLVRGKPAEREPRMMEHGRHRRNTGQGRQVAGDAVWSPQCLSSGAVGFSAGNITESSKQSMVQLRGSRS